MMCGPRNEEESEETGIESEMTEGTEESLILRRFLQNVQEEECQENRECRERDHHQHVFSCVRLCNQS